MKKYGLCIYNTLKIVANSIPPKELIKTLSEAYKDMSKFTKDKSLKSEYKSTSEQLSQLLEIIEENNTEQVNKKQ